MPTFTTVLENPAGNNVAIVVPDEVLDELGGKRVPVVVTVAGYSWRSTTAVMGGRALVGVSAEHRLASGVRAGEEHEVTLERDTEPRTVEVPDDLAAALDDAGAREAFDGLAHTYRKEHVRAVTEAKQASTRERRIARIVSSLQT